MSVVGVYNFKTELLVKLCRYLVVLHPKGQIVNSHIFRLEQDWYRFKVVSTTWYSVSMSDKPTTIDEYIQTQPENVQQILQGMREAIQKALPESTETMSYGLPTFDLNGHHLVYFGAWKDHIGLYPLYHAEGELNDLFADYRKDEKSNSVHLPFDEPFPYDMVAKFAVLRKEQEEKTPSHH